MSKEAAYMEKKWIQKFNKWYAKVYAYYYKSVQENPYKVPKMPDDTMLDKIFDEGQKESFDHVLRKFGDLEEIKTAIYEAVKSDLANKKEAEIPEIRQTTEDKLRKILAAAILATEGILIARDREKEIINIFKSKAMSELANKSKLDGRAQAVFATELIKKESVKQTTQAVLDIVNDTTEDKKANKIKKIMEASYRKTDEELIDAVKKGDRKRSGLLAAGYAIIKKTWNTMRDGHVRQTHAVNDRESILIDELFSVGGYPMAFPADSRYGAPVGERINCRCFLTYT